MALIHAGGTRRAGILFSGQRHGFCLENAMRPTIKLIAAFAVGFAIPAMAANEASWYPVQDATTQKCAVIDKKPTSAAHTIIGGNGYRTRGEAAQIMRTTKSCAVE